MEAVAANPEFLATETLAHTGLPHRSGDGLPRRVAFLLSRYPAVSHTFFLAEVLGLRARGVAVEAASINRPDRPVHQLPEREAAEAATTFYIKNGNYPALLLGILATALLHPVVTLRGVVAVSGLRGLTLRKRLMWFFYLAEALLVGRWMRRRGLKHLHVHFGGPVASVGLLTARAWRMPFSLTIHGPEELLDHSAYHLREKLAAAKFVFCISDFCRSQLCQLAPPAQWHKFIVNRLGVDTERLAPRPMRRAGDLAPNPLAPLHLVCTGRLVAQKGYPTLLEALCLLSGRGVSVRATLIGDGPERPSLESFARKHNLQIRFAGSMAHGAALQQVATADLFVLASFAEGIPVALMEAMALGIPCVSTFVAGIPELIQTGRDGVLTAAGNATALADTIEQLAADPDLRRQLAAQGRRRVAADYNLAHNHDLLAGLWAERLPLTQVATSADLSQQTQRGHA